ncbi:MAG: M20/M25/M40 family metallo-hydrolase [Anaerolineales bacterium]|nr:M20/M25/M40 family metallo-hydrolase [Anaerolineales bacterium]
MSNMKRVDDVIKERLDQSIEELIHLCAQPSISAHDEGMEECVDLVARMLQKRGFQTQILPSKGFPVVVAERGGRSERTLICYNHYDVQPPDPLELWESPPFEPSLRDGKLYARGVSDDKGHILCRLAAIDALLDVFGELPCNMKFVIEGEEEIGSVNLPEFLLDNRNLLAADACLWEFGGVNHEGKPVQSAGMRGICYVELSITTASRDSHSGLGGSIFPNAAWRLIWALSTLKSWDERIHLPGFYEKVIPPTERDLELLSLLPDNTDHLRKTYELNGFLKDLQGGVELRREAVFEPTCTICGLTSGYQGPGSKTVLPAKASAKVDFRLVPDQMPEEVLEQLRAHLDANGFGDIQITYIGGEPPARTDPDDPFLQLVINCAEEVYGVPQLISPMIGGSGPNHAFIHTLKVPIATAGVGYPGSQSHAPNENLDLEHFINGVMHTSRIMAYFGANAD